MKRIAVIVIIIIMAVAIIAGCKKSETSAPATSQQTQTSTPVAVVEGAIAPDFTVQDLSGKEQKLSDLKGKVVLVNFWATWCPPCREEIPSMMKLNKAMAGKPFQLLAISIDEGGKKDIEAFFKKTGMNLPAYLDSNGALGTLYGITGVPETIIVDKQGIVQKRVVGGIDWVGADAMTYLNDLINR
ncbi:MAG: TlpA family protein disulfide reductase [Desulfuromonadales bacterium]|nr:TlpA family protein disulfide reductase [Desulfuromonadales bacterium]